jgi:hypothetical protein
VDGERTIQEIVPFDLVPRPGEVIELHSGRPIIVRHVIEKQRHGLAGIILAWPA